MGTSNPATLRAIAATRASTDTLPILSQILSESSRAADAAQTLVEQLGTPVAPETDEPPAP